MEFIHINKDIQKDIEKLRQNIKDGKDVFVLIYMVGCGPCNATKPEWAKIESVGPLKDKSGIVIADIDKDFVDKLSDVINVDSISGFPTMRHIKNGKEEDFENSSIENKERTVDAFKRWIESKMGDKKGGAKKRRTKRRSRKLKGGKWSRKYKKSINCRRPKGFSQKQYCKYGRKHKKQI